MDNILNTLMGSNTQNDKNKTTKYESDPHKSRKSYLRRTFIFLGFIITLLILPAFFSRDKRYTVPQNSSADVSAISKMKKIETKYNPDTHLMVSHFYVGDPNDIDSASDDRNLANIKYKITYSIENNVEKKYPTKIRKVNDHYFVVETKRVLPGFSVFGYNITPTKIQPNLETDCDNSSINIYLSEDKIQKSNNLVPHKVTFYQENYKQYVLKNYQNVIAKETVAIREKQKLIDEDNRLLAKLKLKLDKAYSKDKTSIEDQIVDTENDIHGQEKSIDASKKRIEEYKDRTSHLSING